MFTGWQHNTAANQLKRDQKGIYFKKNILLFKPG